MDYESGDTIDVQVHSVGIASPLNRVDLQLKRGSAVPVHNLQIGIPLSQENATTTGLGSQIEIVRENNGMQSLGIFQEIQTITGKTRQVRP